MPSTCITVLMGQGQLQAMALDVVAGKTCIITQFCHASRQSFIISFARTKHCNKLDKVCRLEKLNFEKRIGRLVTLVTRLKAPNGIIAMNFPSRHLYSADLRPSSLRWHHRSSHA